MEKAIGLALFLAITSGTIGISPFPGTGAQGLELKSPSLEFLAIGGNSLLPSSTLPEPKVIKTVKVIVTAYSSSVFETDDTPTITASNTEVRDGIIANNLLPFGTKVRLPELYDDKIFVVEDRMNRRKGSYHFDIWFPSHSEAKNFGVENTYLEVLAN
ncbi:MAG: hypothetical protein Q7R84_00770 [bacterium]|nr:hypothetical protein [bacterium]